MCHKCSVYYTAQGIKIRNAQILILHGMTDGAESQSEEEPETEPSSYC